MDALAQLLGFRAQRKQGRRSKGSGGACSRWNTWALVGTGCIVGVTLCLPESAWSGKEAGAGEDGAHSTPAVQRALASLEALTAPAGAAPTAGQEAAAAAAPPPPVQPAAAGGADADASRQQPPPAPPAEPAAPAAAGPPEPQPQAPAACAVPPGMREVTVTAAAGSTFKMVVLGDNDIVSQSIAHNGFHEFRSPQEFAQPAGVQLKAQGTFLDIGANLGYYTLHFASLGYRVYAFEPMTRNRRALNASLCLNPSFAELVTVVPIALTSSTGVGSRCIVESTNHEINIGNGYLQCDEEGKESPRCKPELVASGSCEEVALTTLDKALQDLKVASVDVTKIDTEGWECNVLAGGHSLFSSFKPTLLKVETAYRDALSCVTGLAGTYGYKLVPLGQDTLMALQLGDGSQLRRLRATGGPG